MIPVKDIKELQREFRQVRGGVAADTIFMAKAALLSCEMLAKLLRKQPRERERRRPSEWQTFFGKGMRQGKSPQAIAEEWREKKDGAGD